MLSQVRQEGNSEEQNLSMETILKCIHLPPHLPLYGLLLELSNQPLILYHLLQHYQLEPYLYLSFSSVSPPTRQRLLNDTYELVLLVDGQDILIAKQRIIFRAIS
jgi:hypothetical protein